MVAPTKPPVRGGGGGAGTVDLPAIGRVKKQYLIYGGVAIGALVGYRWYTAQQSEDEGPTFGEGYDEFGNLLGSDPQMVSPGSDAGLTDRTPTTTPFAFNNNAEWTQWVVDYMGSFEGVNAGLMLAAIGDFLAKRPLSPTEQTWIRGALAAAGPPPQGGPYEVIPEQPGTVPTPSAPLGVPAPQVTSVQRTAVTFKWPAVPTATRYYISRVGGGQTSHGATDRSHTTRGLRPNTSYTFRIRAARGSGSSQIVGNVKQFTVKTRK